MFTDEPTPREVFLQSVRRCAATDAFFSEFYERFMATSDAIKDKFQDTDFEKQNRMLRRSLELSAGATVGTPEALREINDRARTHNRYHLNIEPALYDVWLETIIGTARDFDDQWDETVEAAWRRTLGFVIQHMVRKY